MFPGRQAWLVLNQHTAESLLVYIASTTADYCPCVSLIKIDSAYKIYYHSCVVLNHARQGYFRIVPEWVIAQCMLTNFAGKFGWSTVETLCVPNFFTKTNILYQSSQRTVLRHWKYYQLQMYWLWVLQSTHKSWLTVHFTKFLSISCILIINPYIACECFIISFLLASDHVYWMKCKSLHLKEYYVVAVLTLVGICNAAVSVLQWYKRMTKWKIWID